MDQRTACLPFGFWWKRRLLPARDFLCDLGEVFLSELSG